jgi:hypothetical protein
MELVLLRTYHAHGTNGKLYSNEAFQCYTIELPWKDNQPKVSCIPEGRYRLKKRYSPRFQHHILIEHVAGRSLILIHPANDAQKELRGCIAPVSVLTGDGKGNRSRIAFEKMRKVVYEALQHEPIYLTIQREML